MTSPIYFLSGQQFHQQVAEPLEDCQDVLFIGTKNAILKEFYGAEAVAHRQNLLLGADSAADVWDKQLRPLLGSLKPAATGSSPATAKVPLALSENGEEVTNWLHVAVISDVASRHNHKGRPDQVSAAVKSLSTTARGTFKFSRIICVVERASDAYAWAPAITRMFPLYHSSKEVNRRADENDDEGAALLPTTLSYPDETAQEFWVQVLFYGDKLAHGEDAGSIDWKILRQSALHTRLAAAVVDAPCSEMRTTHFIARARRIVERLNEATDGDVNVEVISGEDLRARGLNGIYGVGKCASEFPPALVILSFRPIGAEEDNKSICMVGKGIVFDTGGLSLKGTENMCGMKADCGGAAAVLHAFAALVESGVKTPLFGLLCLAENAIGHTAQRVDDVVYMYSGKTVELNNTDAEGRLVLGDGVAYAAKHCNPSTIVDIATLTGAQGIATGQLHSAVLSDSEELESTVLRAGMVSGNLCFPILYAPELLMPEFESKVSDMKNSVKNRSNAQSSCAGLFIHEHLPSDYAGGWAHIDCAYPAVDGGRGTGYGVALLAHLVRSMNNQ